MMFTLLLVVVSVPRELTSTNDRSGSFQPVNGPTARSPQVNDTVRRFTSVKHPTVRLSPLWASFDCPFTCLCDIPNAAVSCVSDFYSEIPVLPYQTKTAYLMRIKRLQNDAVSHCPQLISLTIGKGLLEIQPHSRLGARNLKVFQIQNTVLQTVPDSLFRGTDFLTNLALNDNHLNKIPNLLFCSTPRLKYLRLDHNKIGSIYFSTCFKLLKRLSYVKLDYNKLNSGQIGANELSNLQHTSLEVLSLVACNISGISTRAFQFFTNLKALNISYNPLVTVLSEALRPLQALRVLFIYSIHLTAINLTLPLQNFASLSLSENKLMYLNSTSLSTIRGCPLRTLYLRQCKIASIASDTFTGFTNLEYLDMSLNNLEQTSIDNLLLSLNDSSLTLRELVLSLRLKKLTNTTFRSSMLNLTILRIRGRVPEISGRAFIQFPYLTELFIERCGLRYLASTALNGLKSLKKLSLAKNLLTVLPRFDLKSVKEFDLSRNRIARIYKQPFSLLKNLEILLLSANGLRDEDFSYNTFRYLRNLKRLDLSRNNLVKLCDRTVSPFHSLESLERLDLYVNSINRINKVTFANLKNLKHLNLASNYLWFQEEDVQDIFKDLGSLSMLSMESCGLSVIPVSLFSNLTNLEILFLGRNSISSWDREIFRSQSKLYNIGLNSNRITLINQTSFMWLKALQIVDLSYNPFECSCNLLWFREWIEQSHVSLYFTYTYPFPKRKIYKCASPNTVQGKSLFKFKILPEDCVDNTTMEILTWTICLFIASVLSVCAIIRWRWYFRYWLFLMRSRTKRYTEIQRRENYMFDAFVCYHADDLGWVINELLPNIEYEHRFKLCLHHRNWIPGIDIAENIVESIDKSRKTILVLTNKFSRSKWCQLEASLAHHTLLGDNRDVVILVMLEKIRAENMTAGLHSLLVSKTYIEWTRNEKGTKLFWWRLRRALAKPDLEGNIEMT